MSSIKIISVCEILLFILFITYLQHGVSFAQLEYCLDIFTDRIRVVIGVSIYVLIVLSLASINIIHDLSIAACSCTWSPLCTVAF
jgi:hypothetical protein